MILNFLFFLLTLFHEKFIFLFLSRCTLDHSHSADESQLKFKRQHKLIAAVRGEKRRKKTRIQQHNRKKSASVSHHVSKQIKLNND